MDDLIQGRYRIAEPLGAGAMGEVFRARDTRLDRDVALKLLPADFAADPERLERFRREARLLARLGHPNIATIHDLEQADGSCFLVLEYVPGASLAERLAGGPLVPRDALAIARQVADALDSAHARGVIHRDLKPANIVITPDGVVKVLDFGLAKSLAALRQLTDPWEPSAITHEPTAQGVLLGTFGYMSPELLRGQPAERPADVWAFGCVLFEALTGRRAFRGATPAETMALVLEREPDWSALPSEVPAGLRGLIERCLVKDPRYRLRDMGDAWTEIDRLLSGGPPSPSRVARRIRRLPRRRWVVMGAALALVSITAAWITRPRTTREPASPPIRFELDIPRDAPLSRVTPGLVVSPDGRYLMYASATGLRYRGMEDLAFASIALGRGVLNPCPSPDGEWLVFNDEHGRLTRMLVADGSTKVIARTAFPRGMAWAPDDSLVYTPGFDTGLWRMSSDGASPRPLTTLDPSRGELTHRWPEVLPGGGWALFTCRTREHTSFDEAEIAAVSLRTGERRLLLEGGTNPRYSPSGHILFARGGRLLAAPFDLSRVRVTGAPQPILDSVDVNPTTGAAQFAVSAGGTLVYAPAPPGGWSSRLVWLDPRGRLAKSVALPVLVESPQISPDGDRIAFTLAGAQNEIGVYGSRDRTVRRITLDPDEDTGPVWTPDGRRIVFSSSRDGALNLFWQPADATGPTERLTTSPNAQAPSGISRDGKILLYREDDPSTGFDIWTFAMQERRARPFRRTRFTERDAVISPDGRWIAYQTDETGRSEIVLESFPGSGSRWQISNGGGVNPQWSPSGDRLYFCSRDQDWMSVEFGRPGSQSPGPPRRLFRSDWAGRLVPTPDGQHFVADAAPEDAQLCEPRRLVVAVGWDRALRRPNPAGR